MKQSIRRFIDHFFRPFGIKTIRIYELAYLHEKFSDSITQLEGFFNSLYPNIIPENKERMELLKGLYGTNVIEALFIIYYLHKSIKTAGDVCEFGVANGATSVLIANELKNTNKNLWLFDSFQGLSKPTKKDKLINDMFGLKQMNKYEGTMQYSEIEVINKLNNINFPNQRINIVPGFINDTVNNKILPEKVCFAYIDFDLYEPTLITLNFLDTVISCKGYIIVDDYNFFSSGVKTAVDQFVKNNKKKYIMKKSSTYEGNFCILQKK